MRIFSTSPPSPFFGCFSLYLRRQASMKIEIAKSRTTSTHEHQALSVHAPWLKTVRRK